MPLYWGGGVCVIYEASINFGINFGLKIHSISKNDWNKQGWGS